MMIYKECNSCDGTYFTLSGEKMNALCMRCGTEYDFSKMVENCKLCEKESGMDRIIFHQKLCKIDNSIERTFYKIIRKDTGSDKKRDTTIKNHRKSDNGSCSLCGWAVVDDYCTNGDCSKCSPLSHPAPDRDGVD
jgi:hypothetical protein|tara:strand:- start:291 stop:695 length:405 start_codon:yes stop_codon:yes gene_type:complete